MKLQPLKQTPAFIALGVILLVSAISAGHFDFFERLERITYDWRVRRAALFPTQVASNLGCVFITNESIEAIGNGLLGTNKSYGLYWPRQIYGRALQELAVQGARTVAFDVMFTGPRRDHAPVPVSPQQWPDLEPFLQSIHPGKTNLVIDDPGGRVDLVESDDQFAWQLHRSGIALLAAERRARPFALFATNALGIGDISADTDPDGVLRRAMAFRTYTNWHFLFRQVAADPDYAIDLSKAVVTERKITLPRTGALPAIEIPLDANGRFELSAFGGNELPPGLAPTAAPFSLERVWHMGILLAAQELHLNLAEADVDLRAGRIVLSGPNGLKRVLPVDARGYFYINWEIEPEDPQLTSESFDRVLVADQTRRRNPGGGGTNFWKDKLVVIGSAATGNDLTDRGATPLSKDTLLVSKHWNVANSVIMGRFIRPASGLQSIGAIALLGAIAALMTWRLRALPGLLSVIVLAAGYILVCLVVFVQHRIWWPVVLPVMGSLFVQYGLLVTYRVVFEQREQRRVKSVFKKIVAPDVVNELLGAEQLSLGGARREVTVMFADIRGFTELTDRVQEQTAAHIREEKLSGAAAEHCYDTVAEETLQMVSLYLGLIADVVKQHHGTLDKYIGDCAMAFWGAPKPNVSHARDCVRAAIDAQRQIHELNQRRRRLNEQIEVENAARLSAGLPPRALLPLLYLGTGINSGPAMVGLMGSDAHGLNYTVLGREVNLASRLESVSGQGRIIIGEATYEHLRRDDLKLAATCVELEPTRPKGFQKAVRNFEVPWQESPG